MKLIVVRVMRERSHSTYYMEYLELSRNYFVVAIVLVVRIDHFRALVCVGRMKASTLDCYLTKLASKEGG